MRTITIKIVKNVFVGVDGSFKEIYPVDGKDFTLDEMYKIIGCETIEHVQLAEDVDLWCDEEGLLKSDWIINPVATVYYRKAYPDVDPEELAIVGSAIIQDKTKEGNFFK